MASGPYPACREEREAETPGITRFRRSQPRSWAGLQLAPPPTVTPPPGVPWPHSFTSPHPGNQLPTPLARAKTSTSCSKERFSRSRKGQTKTPPILDSVHIPSGRVCEGREEGRHRGCPVARQKECGGQWACKGGLSPLRTPHDAPHAPSRKGVPTYRP